jgi:hypothetical protein
LLVVEGEGEVDEGEVGFWRRRRCRERSRGGERKKERVS